MNGNKTQSNDFLQILLAVKRNTMKETHVSTVATVVSIDAANMIASCKRLTSRNTDLLCIIPYDMDVQQGDIVCVLFTDDDFRVNLTKIKNNASYADVETSTLHSLEYGIVIKIIHRTVTQ